MNRPIFHLVTEFDTVDVTSTKILRFQGYRDMPAAPKQVRQAAQVVADMTGGLLEPTAAYTVLPVVVDLAANNLRIHDGPTFHSAQLVRNFHRAQSCIAFVATIGYKLATRVDELHSAGNDLESFLLDSAGTIAVYVVVSQVRARAAQLIGQKDHRLVGRLGPGHGDWPIRDQSKLFSLFDGYKLPVVLSKYDIMSPEKSMSGLVAIVPMT